jgi:pSer/pThr/pTyr-binding forkhead associated (FHA) protein
MALTIVVRSAAGRSAPRITFDAPRVIVGRGEGCEVRLPDPSVSHRHASIRQRGAEYIVMDEGSANGTYVGPVRLSPQAPRVLKSGDLVRVGRVWLEVSIEQTPPTANAPMATRELALALIADALAADGEAAAPCVRVTDGPGTGSELVMDMFERAYVVGRMKSADLNIEDLDLSRRHVEIFRRGERIFVRDLGSKNGSKVGDKRLDGGEEVPWPKGVVLEIGKTKLSYDDPVGRALEELESAPDERLDDGELIDPPKLPDDRTGSSVTSTGVPPSPSRRGAPVASRPRRPEGTEQTGWTVTDVLVATLAVIVLAVSIGGLVWLMRSG